MYHMIKNLVFHRLTTTDLFTAAWLKYWYNFGSIELWV